MFALVSAAVAGEAEGEVAFDLLHATSASEAPASGPEPALSSTELGMRVRGTVEHGRLLAALDYQGREAVAGTFQNTPYRLVYRAEIVGALVEDRLDLGVGRFLAPSVVFLPVDGARLAWTPSDALSLTAFGGRRGISTARTNLGFDEMLPAVGLAGAWRHERASADLLGSYAGDQVSYGTEGVVPGDPTRTITDTVTSLAATVGGTVEPMADAMTVGLRATATQDATWVLAATSTTPELQLQSVDLYQGLAFLRWRPADTVRVDVDALRQAALVPIVLAPASEPGQPAAPIVDPTFSDLRARGAVRVVDAGWIRPDVRLRLRADRTELRSGLGADVDRLWIPGPFVRARAWFDDILMDRTGDDVAAVDRLLWSASAGWSEGGFEIEGGASFVDRAAGPVSGRSTAPTQLQSDDLSPFVLEAQNIVFLRSFVATRRWFGGADLEANVIGPEPEVRAFVQIGLLGDASW